MAALKAGLGAGEAGMRRCEEEAGEGGSLKTANVTVDGEEGKQSRSRSRSRRERRRREM